MSFTELQPILDLLDMATLDRWLRSTATKNRLIAAEDLTGPNPTSHGRLAGLVACTGLSGLREAVSVASKGIPKADLTPVAIFLAWTAKRALHHANTPGTPVMTAAAEQSVPGELRVSEPRLAGLALIPLATDMARSGGLVIVVDELPGRMGMCGPEKGIDVVSIDIDASEAYGWDLNAVLAHELAHLLDPHRGLRATPDLDERFARKLGPLLVEELPATVAEANVLVERVLKTTNSAPIIATSDDAALERFEALFWWFTRSIDNLEDVPAAV